jgi:hypothetical protein
MRPNFPNGHICIILSILILLSVKIMISYRLPYQVVLVFGSDVNRPARSIGQPPAWPISAWSGWPARPADGKFANFKINQLLTQF